MQHARDDRVDRGRRKPGIQCPLGGRLGGDGAEHILCRGTCEAKRKRWSAAELDRGDHRGQLADDVDFVRLGRTRAARAACRRDDRRPVPIALVSSSGRGGSDANSALVSVSGPDRDDVVLPVDVDERVVVSQPNRHRVHVLALYLFARARCATQAPTGSSPPARNQA